MRTDDLKVGADGGLGIIIGLLIVAIPVIVIIMLAGHRIVVK
jgi:hypothetical protein